MFAAWEKIHRNRHKDAPGEWHPRGFSVLGERTWNWLPREWLSRKLAEETTELIIEAVKHEGHREILQEAGDVTAVAMMIADNTDSLTLPPKVVCLCGSTKFKDAFLQAQFEETMQGNIVLTVGFFHHTDGTYTLSPEEKENLDWLHKRKIDLCDEILVLNVGGYIGDSTRSEIDYARLTGKPVRWLQTL
jgi:hypothetical protein